MHTFLVVSMDGNRIAQVRADLFEETVHHPGPPKAFTEHKFSIREWNQRAQTYSRHHVATISTPLGSSVIREDAWIDVENPHA